MFENAKWIWTDERRKLWGERHKRKDTNPNKHLFYEFTGFIKCGCCGANYRCQSGMEPACSYRA